MKRTRYTPRGQRDTILIRVLGYADGERQAHHQDASLALVEAQSAALELEHPTTLEVVRRPIGMGREAVLYRVVRDDEGAVLTHTIDLED